MRRLLYDDAAVPERLERPSTRRRLAIVVLIVGVCAGLAAAFCGGEEGPIVWSDDPAPWRWEGQWGWRDYEWIADRNVEMSKAIRQEREWCLENHIVLPDRIAPETVLATDTAASLAHLEQPLQAETREWMAQIVAELERLYGVTLDDAPDVRIFSPDTWRRLQCWTMLRSERLEPPPPIWELGRLLGYLDPDWTPAMQTHLSRSYIVAFYSSSERNGLITLVSDMPLPERTVETFAHEVVHALQDRLLNGGLDALYNSRTTDRFFAANAVVEGDAEVTIWSLYDGDPFLQRIVSSHSWGREQPLTRSDVLIGYMGMSGSSVIAPYDKGRQFVQRVQRELGDEAVRDLLYDPPESYEQILHRRKFAADEQPAPIEPLLQLRDQVLEPADTASATIDTLGEGILADLIGFSTVDTTRARAAARGWATDAITLVREFNGEPNTIVIWQIAFDDQNEHAEGVRGLREWLVAASGGEAVEGRNRQATGWEGPAGAIRVVNHAGLAWIIAAEEGRTADLVTARIFDLEERWSRPDPDEG